MKKNQRKEDQVYPLEGDSGHDFSEEDHILNWRPKIQWVEPDSEFLEGVDTVEVSDNIEDVRNRVKDLVDGYKRVSSLIDLAVKRIDARVKSGGGLEVNLDPIADQSVIAAIKRRFPKEDSSKITYKMYKQALQCMQAGAPLVPAVTAANVRAAKADPTTTNFGGYGNKAGTNRPEVNSLGQAAKPVDLQEYQKNAVISLFKLMEPLISNNSSAAVKLHERTNKHS